MANVLLYIILDKHTVDTHGRKYIRDNNMILKRYEFNNSELTVMGGEVVYK